MTETTAISEIDDTDNVRVMLFREGQPPVHAPLNALLFEKGNVTGPASSTDNAFVKWNGTTGQLLKDGPVTIPITDGGTGQTTASAAFGALKQAATTSATGVVELATDAEAIAKSDTARALVPANLAALIITDVLSGLISTPSNQDYRLVVKIPFGGTITETVTRSTAGTATATFKINTTALGGTANSVSTTEQAQTHSSANAFVADDDIVLTISSASSCTNLSFTIKFTRLLLI